MSGPDDAEASRPTISGRQDRPTALAKVLGYLDEIGIASCGRYGRWGYHWTDEAFTSGEEAAQQSLDR